MQWQEMPAGIKKRYGRWSVTELLECIWVQPKHGTVHCFPTNTGQHPWLNSISRFFQWILYIAGLTRCIT